MDNLLFETKGMNKTFIKKMKISMLISFCISILMLILMNIKVEKTRYFIAIQSTADPLPKYKAHLISNASDRILFLYIGIVCIMYSIIGLFVIAKWNKTYFKIYDNYIEGVTFDFTYRNFKYFYNEIKHVEKQKHKLIINTNIRNIGISINGDIDNAYTIIQNKIHN